MSPPTAREERSELTHEEFQTLWDMMRECWPNSPKLRKPVTRKLWQKALEPYNAQDVEDAIINRSRTDKFFPDIADITASLQPEVPTDEEADAKAGSGYAQWHIPPGQEFQHNFAVLCEMRELLHTDGKDFDDYLFQKFPKAWTQRQKARAERAQRRQENPELYARLDAEMREIEETVRDKLRKERRI